MSMDISGSETQLQNGVETYVKIKMNNEIGQACNFTL